MFTSILCLISAFYLWNSITGGIASPTPEECSRAFVGDRGVITSYNYPFDYLHNLTCTYSILVTDDPDTTNVVCLTFHRFALESSTPFCSFDYLKLEYPELKYCANGLWMYGVQTTAPGSNVWSKDFCWTVKNTRTFDITFASDNNINAAGFYAEYFVFPGEENERVLPPGNLGQAPCATDEWTCFNRRCIAETLLCDGTNDCGDNSDETYVHARCGEQNVLACDFTTGSVSDGYCGFTHEGWFRTREQNSPYGPQGDHTNGSSGYYVYSDVNQSSAFLLSPELTLTRNKTFCLAFWYYIYGRPPAARLRVYVTRDQAYSRPEWSRSHTPDSQWIKGEIVINSQADIQIIFAAELDNSFSGVALDDVSILPGSCLGDDISCNFESGLCAWRAMPEIEHVQGTLRGDLTWTPHSRILGPSGPSWDQSSKDGGGHYLFLNNTNRFTTDNRALLESPAISAFYGSLKCLQFWYHMNGLDRDCCQLKVKVTEADGRLVDAVWSKTGAVRNAWKEAYVNLNMGEPFKIVIEGMISSSSRSQIAIDQVVLTDGLCLSTGSGECEAGQYLCAEGACVNATWRCDGKIDCVDGSDEDWRAGCPTPTPEVPPPTVAGPSTPVPGPPVPPTCATGYSPCRQSPRCILSERFCDHYSDCPDRSDESSLSGCRANTALHPCPTGRYRCQNGRCVPENRLCDGVDDCGDHSDEKNCHVTTLAAVPTTCATGYFLCVMDESCVPKSRLCDGIENCADGSDESTEYAECIVALTPTSATLSIGAIIGIVVGCIACVAIILLSAFLGKRRRKSHPRRNTRRSAAQNPRAEISTISEPSTIERHMNMLEAIRSPMRNLSGLPPYSEQNLENMGYTSDGTVTLGRGGTGMIFPPEEPPPPYDSVIKEQSNDGSRGASSNNTPLSTPGPSNINTPEDDSYGFRSRSSSGRAPRRKSRERTPVRAQNTANERQERELPLVTMESRVPSEPSIEICIPHPSDDSDTANIYEELNVPTLRPTRVRQEPSSSSTLQNPPIPVGLPPSGFSAYGSQQTPSTSHSSAANATLPHLPGRTLPQQRIRLGTQALQSRQGSGTYRPRDQAPASGPVSPPQGPRGYEPLDPPGPYSIQRNPYNSIPSPSPSSAGSIGSHPGSQSQLSPGNPNTTTPMNRPVDFHHSGEPASSYTGRHSQRQNWRPNMDPSNHGRMYGSNRNPSRPSSQVHMPQSELPQNQNILDGQRYNTQPVPELNPALSLRAMPNPRPYSDNTGRLPRSTTVPSPLQVDNYLYRPRDSLNQSPVDHGGVAPDGVPDRTRLASEMRHHREMPRSQVSPAPVGHTRDWNNSSFASTGSQEHLINSPPGAQLVPSRYPNHLRNGSNISSDIDSTSPLVSNRDRERGHEREDSIEMDALTATSV